MNAIKLKILRLLREINELEKNIMIVSIYEDKTKETEIKEIIKNNNNTISEKRQKIIDLEKEIEAIRAKEIEKNREKEDKNKIEEGVSSNSNTMINDIRLKNIEKNKKEMKLNEEKKRLKKEKLMMMNIKH